jgi:hypothetical protein
MMRIHVTESDDQVVLAIEGRLAEPFVSELRAAWRTARDARPERQVVADVGNVTCVDRAGRVLLQSMYANGVHFLRAGMAMQDILEQIMETQRCG